MWITYVRARSCIRNRVSAYPVQDAEDIKSKGMIIHGILEKRLAELRIRASWPLVANRDSRFTLRPVRALRCNNLKGLSRYVTLADRDESANPKNFIPPSLFDCAIFYKDLISSWVSGFINVALSITILDDITTLRKKMKVLKLLENVLFFFFKEDIYQLL